MYEEATSIENFKIELNNITYIFDMFINSDDFYNIKTDAESLKRAENCQLAIFKNFKDLKKFNEDFQSFADYMLEDKNIK